MQTTRIKSLLPTLATTAAFGAGAAQLISSWADWRAKAEVQDQLDASRETIGSLFRTLGEGSAGFFVSCPVTLTRVTLAVLAASPLLAFFYALSVATTSTSLRGRLLRIGKHGGLFSLAQLAAFAVATASVVHEGAVSSGLALSWGSSLWLRACVVTLPGLALMISVRELGSTFARRVLLGLLAFGCMSVLADGVASQYPILGAWGPYRQAGHLFRVQGSVVTAGCIATAVWVVAFAAATSLLARLKLAVGRAVAPVLRRARGRRAVAALVVLALVAVGQQASAYTGAGHFGLAVGAYQIMRAANSSRPSPAPEAVLKAPGSCATGSGLCGRTVSAAEWTQFIDKIDKSRRILGSLDHEVPNFQKDGKWCFVDDTSNFDVARLPHHPRAGHMTDGKQQCKVEADKTDEKYYLFADVTPPADGVGNQGAIIGYHAKSGDDHINDTKLDVLPVATVLDLATGTPPGSTTFVMDVVHKAHARLLQALFAPFVCLFRAVSGGDVDRCAADAYAFAEKTDIAAFFVSLLPGFGLDRSHMFSGMWHFINIRSTLLSNSYDDHQGYHPNEAGPEATPGTLDLALAIAAEAADLRLTPDQSDGTYNYEIRTSADGHQATKHRNENQWRYQTLGGTQFEPLDNFAYYGFRTFTSNPLKRLSWALHAVGDATVPMHVVGTSSWGHVPYEHWVEAHLDELLYTKCSGVNCSEQTLRNAQVAQSQRVLQQAFKWNEVLQSGGIRNFITALAADTLAKAGGDSMYAWPYCDACSTFFQTEDSLGDFVTSLVILLDLDDIGGQPAPTGRMRAAKIAEDPMAYYNDYMANIRTLTESSMAATIALVTWATSDIGNGYPQCIYNERHGCKTNADCCMTSKVCGAADSSKPNVCTCVETGKTSCRTSADCCNPSDVCNATTHTCDIILQ